jgi:KipI family sensor histidine kinase inhibitor
MISRSLQIDRFEWRLSPLGERALVLEPESVQADLSVIHKVCSLIEQSALDGLTDVIPSYKSIGLVFREPVSDIDPIVDQLSEIIKKSGDYKPDYSLIRVPVCYELGLDWDVMESYTGMKKDEIVRIHTETSYTLAMMGFIPGFLYLNGLDESIHCPRKNDPRRNVPAGAVGIGGSQTGIYSLESPGGWQIVGRTPLSFFNKGQQPPVSVSLGDTIRFEPISEKEFKRLESGGGV